MDHNVLGEQIAYYRARAQEYDETTGTAEDSEGAFAQARKLLQQRGPWGQVLELACGTGAWTRVLLPLARDIIALDAAPEMLAIARQKLADTRVHYQQADLFQWEPEREYDLVFSANWLSHVPPKKLDSFLARVARAVRPGGYVAIIDQYAPTAEDRQIVKAGEEGDIYALRPLRSGKTFTIVKIFYDRTTLEEKFTALGFEVIVHLLDDIFFFFEARRR